MSRFKLYRWWKGGKWFCYHGEWGQPDKDGWCHPDGAGFHWTLNGLRREEYP